jgi:hypothetical protein
VEEADGIADRILDKHASGVACDELVVGSSVIGEKDSGLVVAEIENVDLSEGPSVETDLFLEDTWVLESTGGDIEFDTTPGGSRKGLNLFDDFGGTSSEGDEGDFHLIQSGQVSLGREGGIEDEVARQDTVLSLPELNEGKDLAGFLAFANIGPGVAEGAVLSILGEKDENAGLAPGSGGDEVLLNDGILSIVGD